MCVFNSSLALLSVQLDSVAPVLSSPSSVPSVISALNSPRNLSYQLARRPNQPNHFPLFPHPVNIVHTRTLASSFHSIVCFTVRCAQDFSRVRPSPIGPFPSHTPINPLDATLTSLPVSIDSKRLTQSLNPLNATLTKKRGGPRLPGRAIHHSLLTAPLIPLHYSP